MDDTNTVDLDTTYVYDGENLNIVVHNDAPDPGEGGSPLTGIGETAIPLACIGFIVAGVIAVVILRFKKNYLLGVGGHE